MSEWGPWIEHDGGPCPCVGEFVHAVFDKGRPIERKEIATGNPKSWIFKPPADRFNGCIVRYRIRKPRGLTILENLIAEIPEEVTG